jgi:hypothetical protein
MRLGIMQPYFFPYLGYFDLINRVDRWIIFDTAQYIRHGWVNRNRILHPTEGWQYILVPLVKHSRDSAINDVQTKDPSEWRPRILGQISHYRKRAPYFPQTYRLVEECLGTDQQNLAQLNAIILIKVCAYLGIAFNYTLFSEMNLTIGPVVTPGDWALRISEAIKADEYLNPPGGEDLFDRAQFAAAGIRLRIQETFEFSYACPGYKFEPNLSVVDALMWNSPETVKAFLDRRRAAVAE